MIKIESLLEENFIENLMSSLIATRIWLGLYRSGRYEYL